MLKIFTITHKIIPDLENDIYVLMQAGKSEEVRKGIKRDIEGDSIADKNPYYSELTAAYWLWKNEKKIKYIGLAHYRRFLNIFPENNRSPLISLSQEDFKKTKFFKKNKWQHKLKIFKYLFRGIVIVPKPIDFNMTVYEQYKQCHDSNHLDKVVEIILRDQPEYKAAIDQVLNAHSLRICNMFISSKKFWDTYHEWLFTLFFKLEKEITIPEDFYQQRVYAFLSERLFNFYLIHNKVKVKQFGFYFIEY